MTTLQVLSLFTMPVAGLIIGIYFYRVATRRG